MTFLGSTAPPKANLIQDGRLVILPLFSKYNTAHFVENAQMRTDVGLLMSCRSASPRMAGWGTPLPDHVGSAKSL
jgi:hypothetical protein